MSIEVIMAVAQLCRANGDYAVKQQTKCQADYIKCVIKKDKHQDLDLNINEGKYLAACVLEKDKK